MKTKMNSTKKTLFTLWDILLQVAKVAGSVALFMQDWTAAGLPGSKILSGILLASVFVHYIQTRKD